MNREYFSYGFNLDDHDASLIWFSDEPDGVVVDADGKIPCFLHNEDLLRYASSLNLSVEIEEPSWINLDLIILWLKDSGAETVDCVMMLNAWNLFQDVSHSVGGSFDPDQKKTKKIYEKLFWGNNLPAVTPQGESYTPSWSKRELKIMQEVLTAGLSLFREKISYI